MRNINKKALKILAQITRNEVCRDKVNEHPFCLGIFHQPKRPMETKK